MLELKSLSLVCVVMFLALQISWQQRSCLHFDSNFDSNFDVRVVETTKILHAHKWLSLKGDWMFSCCVRRIVQLEQNLEQNEHGIISKS